MGSVTFAGDGTLLVCGFDDVVGDGIEYPICLNVTEESGIDEYHICLSFCDVFDGGVVGNGRGIFYLSLYQFDGVVGDGSGKLCVRVFLME